MDLKTVRSVFSNARRQGLGVRTAASMTMAAESMVAEPTKRAVTFGTYWAAAVLADNR